MNDQRRRKIEDALAEASLELLMDDYTEQSGEILWQEFQSDADCVMPGDLDKACQDLIHTSFSKSVQESCVKPISARLKQLAPQACKAAMIAFAMVGAMATLTLSVEAIRVPVLNYFIAQDNRYTIISASKHEENLMRQESINNIRSLLPSEYDVVFETSFGDGFYNLCYQDAASHIITIRSGPSGGQLYVDTENAEQEEIEVNGCSCLLISKNGMRIVITKEESDSWVDFYAEDIPQKKFWEIALALSL